MPEPQWLDRELVDELHAQSLRIHGGLPGIRDVCVLEAAIASPRNLWAYGGEDDPFRLAFAFACESCQGTPLQRRQQTRRDHLRSCVFG